MLTPQNGIQVDKFYPPTDWQYSFPEGYTRLEYLEFTGTQYINTNYVPNNNVDISITTSFKNISGNVHTFIEGGNSWRNDEILICANQTSANGNGRLIGFKGTDSSFVTTNLPTSIPYANTKHTYEIKDYSFYIDKQLIFTFNTTNISTTNTMYIGAYHRNSGVGEYLIGNVYVCQIWDDGTLVRNFVPVKRNSDNKPGMYDLVNNVFYVNQGTGEFVMGPALYQNKTQIDIRQKNNLNFGERYKFNANNELTWANPDLYLSNENRETTRPYLQISNITVTTNYKFELNATNTINYGSSSGAIINTTSNNWAIFFNYINKIYYKFNSSSSTNSNLSFTKGKRTFITLDNTNIICNGNKATTAIGSATQSSTTLYIFRTTSGGTGASNDFIGKLYGFKIYENNTLLYNFVPVPAGLQIGDFTVPSNGMFDIVNQQFYGNQGTGSFKFGQTRDIKVIPPEDNTITLLYGVASDFSKYSLFGLLANVSSGTYDVYIDDVLYATTTKNTQTDIDFSALGSEYVPIGTCTTPESLVLHKIVVKPSTSGQTITLFRCARTSGISSRQYQGVLWGHLQLDNQINITNIFSYQYNYDYTNAQLTGFTAKNNYIITPSGGNYRIYGFVNNSKVTFIPKISNALFSQQAFYLCSRIKRIESDNIGALSPYVFSGCYALEQISRKNINLQIGLYNNAWVNIYKLKLFIAKNINYYDTGDNFITNAIALYPIKININPTGTKEIRMKGTSTYPMRGLRGLKVSNEAPFSGSSPQINVSYTGLDRDALVELFNSMPYNVGYTEVGTPTITDGVVSGFSDSNYLEIQQPFVLNSDTVAEIVFKINFDDDTGSVFLGHLNTYGIQMTRRSNEKKIQLFLGNNNSWSLINNATGTTILSNLIDYYIKVAFNKGNVKVLLSTDNINWSTEINRNITLSEEYTYIIDLGKGRANGQYLRGSIDLNSTYIKIKENNEWIPWFTGKAARASNPQINITATTGNNLTKVGTPTIDENGVASGFSASNYLKVQQTLDTSKPFEIKVKFQVNSYVNNHRTLFGVSSNGVFNFSIRSSGSSIANAIRLACGTSSSAFDICDISSSANSIETDKIYYAKAVYTGTQYELWTSEDNKNWTLVGSQASSSLINNGTPINLQIGNGHNDWYFNDGSIDLENTYIKVGNNYLMKGYLTDNDKAILTKKNWTLA